MLLFAKSKENTTADHSINPTQSDFFIRLLISEKKVLDS